jgi:hypothetical protein
MFIAKIPEQFPEPLQTTISRETNRIGGQAQPLRNVGICGNGFFEKQSLDDLPASIRQLIDSAPDQLFLIQTPNEFSAGILAQAVRFHDFHGLGLETVFLPDAITLSDCNPDQPGLQAVDIPQ